MRQIENDIHDKKHWWSFTFESHIDSVNKQFAWRWYMSLKQQQLANIDLFFQITALSFF